MENQKTIVRLEDGVTAASNGKVTSKKTFGYKGLALIAAGLAMIVAQTFDKENGTLTMFLLVAGLCLVLWGVVVFAVKKTRFFYGDKPMTMREFTFDADRYADVLQLYRKGDFSAMLDISRTSSAKMKMKILHANDYSAAFSQLYKFVDYDFAPQGPIATHDADQCRQINTLAVSY